MSAAYSRSNLSRYAMASVIEVGIYACCPEGGYLDSFVVTATFA